jgi:lipoprotein-releasing system permease protein
VTSAKPESKPYRLIVVDDDGRIRDLLRRYLTQEGFEVLVAEDARALDRLLLREHADLIVLDLMMPGEDGLSVCRRLRARQDAIPVIMLTAKGDDVDRIVGLELGADDYLPKPFNPRELLARVNAVLRRRPQREAPGSPAALGEKVVLGDIRSLQDGSGRVAIGTRLAQNIGARVGDTITIINPQGRATPFGTSIRQIGYEVGAIFEVGIYDYDEKFVVLPIKDAQTLLLMGDSIGMIEVTVDDPDRVGEILQPVADRLAGRAVIADWKTINSALFEALQVERVAMFFALSFMVLVAAFNILSSLVMLVRAKTRDIAILRTMGATRQSLLKIFVTTGTTIGAIGTAGGLALGAVVLFFREPIVAFIAFTTGQEIWDPEVRFLSALPSRSDPWEITGIVTLALVLSFLATLYPALKAANTDPVQVLRYE